MYDRNGNRLEEIRVMSDELDETLHREANGTLVHDISPTSNRLLGVDKGSSPISDLITYDDIGNVAVIFRTINGIQVQQDFTYGNALVPMLPTEIHQHAQFESHDPNQELEVKETFSYDFSGARISRTLTVYEMPEGASEPDEVVNTTYYLPSGTENLAELDQYGRVSRAYQFAGGERIGYKSKRIHARYVKDHLGSTRQTIALNLWKTQDPMNVPQSAAGDRSLNQAMRYAQADSGPFGLSTREAANSGANFEPHRFTGQELEPQIGLYYMGARFYDPDLGRFLQVDPAREFWNSYSYVGNNPVKLIDPNGRNARVSIDFTNHTIQIQAKIFVRPSIFYSTTLEERNSFMDRIKMNIESVWQGEYEIDGVKWKLATELTVAPFHHFSQLFDDDTNLVTIKPSGYRSTVNGNTWSFGDWSIFSPKGDPYAHEFGHFLTLPDQYIEAYGTTQINAGYEDELMGGSRTTIGPRTWEDFFDMLMNVVTDKHFNPTPEKGVKDVVLD